MEQGRDRTPDSWIELPTPGSAVRLASVTRHVTDCTTWPGILYTYLWPVLVLTLCPLGNLHVFLSWADFLKSTFLKSLVGNTIRVSNSLDPDQAQQNVWPDLDPNCLQRLLADNTRRQGYEIKNKTT